LFGFPGILVFVAGVTACTGEIREEYNILIGKLKGVDHLKGLSIKRMYCYKGNGRIKNNFIIQFVKNNRTIISLILFF
jgi:hypothetical protein